MQPPSNKGNHVPNATTFQEVKPPSPRKLPKDPKSDKDYQTKKMAALNKFISKMALKFNSEFFFYFLYLAEKNIYKCYNMQTYSTITQSILLSAVLITVV